jgi:hypothetical protein
MTKKHTLIIPIKPKAKGRPRAGKYGMYTDKATREHEQAIKDAYDGPLFERSSRIKHDVLSRQDKYHDKRN